MLFRNPEVFYFLFLALIPLIVHLFQLQKFKKIPFTNVAFLKKIESNTRKSSNLKKWILLATRTLGLLAILFAFSQPYISDKSTLTSGETTIYFDNSLSISANLSNGNRFKNLITAMIENASPQTNYNLITHSKEYRNLSYSALKNALLNLEISTKKHNTEHFLLKIQENSLNKTKTLSKNILITDFQNYKYSMFTNVTREINTISSENQPFSNLSIDSLSFASSQPDYLDLTVFIQNRGPEKKDIPLAVYNGKNLITKQIFSIGSNTTTPIQLTLKKESNFLGEIRITYNDTFLFDNHFYFSLSNPSKTKILSIGKPLPFLTKIFTADEFEFSQRSIQSIDYNTLQSNDLILLNEVKSIPSGLMHRLKSFASDGGTLVIVPSSNSDFEMERELTGTKAVIPYSKKTDSLKITNLNTTHPFFKNVFNKKVTNFSYPFVKASFQQTNGILSSIVSYENKNPFFGKLQGDRKIFFFTAPLNESNTNIKNSPLIVTLFYTLGQLSFKQPQLYYQINSQSTIDVKTKLEKDEILSIHTPDNSFIPLQKAVQNKVEIDLSNQELKAGFHYVLRKKDTVAVFAMNNPKNESNSEFLDIKPVRNTNKNIVIYDSPKALFEAINDFNEVNWLWKWFISIAIVSLLAEILLLKFFKV